VFGALILRLHVEGFGESVHRITVAFHSKQRVPLIICVLKILSTTIRAGGELMEYLLRALIVTTLEER
jgi:hypothetical protein